MAYCRSGKLHRIKACSGRKLSRAAHLPRYIPYGGGSLLRSELERHRPAGKLLRGAQYLPGSKVPDLDHHSVYQEVQMGARLLRFIYLVADGLDIVAEHQIVAYGEAVFPEEPQHLVLGFQFLAFDIAYVVAVAVKPALGGNSRIQIAQRSRRSVPCVFQLFIGGLVYLVQHRQLHIAFALHLHLALEGYGKRHRAYGLYLWGYVLAYDAVAPRRAGNQPAALVCEVYGQAVKLIFKGVFDLRKLLRLRNPLHPSAPVYKILPGAHLVKAP